MWEMILELGGEFLAVLFGLVFTLGLPVAGIYLLVTGRSRDEQRIGRYLSLRGDRFLGCERAQTLMNWLAHTSQRLYRVRYVNGGGDHCEGFARTSLFSGVFFADERVTLAAPLIHPTPPVAVDRWGAQYQPAAPAAGETDAARIARLEAELHALREEVRRLREE